MKGYSLSYWPDIDEWRAAHIIERPNAYGKVESVWRDCPPPENVESKMVAIANAVRSNEIDGFTLFYQPTRKGWQMSIRRKGEPGWDIQIVTEGEAQSVFSMLEARGHPDGPLALKPMVSWPQIVPGTNLYEEIAVLEGPRSIGKHPGLAAPYGDPLKAALRRNVAASTRAAELWERLAGLV